MPDSIASNSDEQPIVVETSSRPWFEPMGATMERIANYSERAREMNPGLINLSPTLAATTGLTDVTHERRRIYYIVITTITAGTLAISFGGTTYTFAGVANSTNAFYFPISVDRGVNITATHSASQLWKCYIFYYPE
jgi:hypothetical protein